MEILFIQTGGTIDKDYPRTTGGWAFEITDPAVERILDHINPTFTSTITTVLRKDSQEITDEDRASILDTCQSSHANKIIITHGTDTMIETAQVLSELANKTIVITGSMRPEKFSDSDAPFNVGVAVGAVQTLVPGVYIAMNGIVRSWDRVERNLETGQFVEKKQ